MFADSVKGRIELRTTSYRNDPDNFGRGYITFDKEEIWNMCSLTTMRREFLKCRELLALPVVPDGDIQDKVYEQFVEEGIYSKYGFFNCLKEFSSNSIEVSLASKNLLVRCLAMLDSRFGKRRIKNFDISNEHEKVVQFYNIRCECEGMIGFQ